MLADLAALCRALPTGNNSERNQTKVDELGISSGPLLILNVLLEGFAKLQMYASATFILPLKINSVINLLLITDVLLGTSVVFKAFFQQTRSYAAILIVVCLQRMI